MGTTAVEIVPGVPVVRRRAVPAEEPLIGTDRYDYADTFEVRMPEPDARSAEEVARAALEQAPRAVRWIIHSVHRYVVRFRLGPSSSRTHVIGWKIVSSQPEAIVLETASPLVRAVIVARRTDPTVAVATTYLFFARPTAARIVWAVVGPLHRRIAPYLLERAAALG
jgi:hypothetical protein